MSKTGKGHDEVLSGHEAGWMRRLAVYCWRFKRDVIISLGGSVLYTVTALLIPLFQRSIIDNVIVTHRESVWPLAIGLAVAALAGFAGVYLRRYRGGKMALDVQHTLRTDLFESLSTWTARGRTRSTPGSSSAGRSPTSTWCRGCSSGCR